MTDPMSEPITAQGDPESLVLADGRQVTLLPRAGGHAWSGTVASWDTSEPGRVVARVRADAEAVDALDHHQVWLSTVTRGDQEQGITIFAGTALAAHDGSLVVDGVVRLVSERRRASVRATGGLVRIPHGDDHPARTVPATDISRGGVRLAMAGDTWTYGDKTTVVIELPSGEVLEVHTVLVRTSADDVVLELVDLGDAEAAALDRYAISRLPTIAVA
jgi:hypothetical protein